MNYNRLAQEAHDNSVKHGFWDQRESNEHYMMLIISEVGEMVEAHRTGKRADDFGYCNADHSASAFEACMKDTLEDEMADVVIRLGDLAGALGIDFSKMHPCRYHRAYDKFSFTENAYALSKGLCRDLMGYEKRILFGLEFVSNWAKAINVDLDWHVKEKMKYNAARPKRHGKAY